MGNIPLVSVMMLTYNHGRYIGEAIRGVVFQKFNHQFELVIGDDCSTDDTLQVCREWQKRFPHIIKILERPRNIGVQRNLIETISACRGKYLAKCEGDDYWCSKHKLRRQVDYMERHSDCNVCFHRVINYYSHNNTKSLSNSRQKTDTTIADLAKSNYITNLSVMYRRSVLPDLPDWLPEVPAPDYSLHMLHAATGYIHFIDLPMAVYRKHAQGVWGIAAQEKQLRIAMNSRVKLIEYFSSNAAVRSGLVCAFTSIALSLAAIYDGNEEADKAEDVKRQIMRFHEDWDDDTYANQLNAHIVKQKGANRSVAKMLLRKLRGLLSRMVPLPRIRNF